MAWPIVAERIEIGDEMPQFAVGMNQVLGFNAGARLVRAWLFGGVESSREVRRTAAGSGKTREKRLPIWVYRTRVGLILFVQTVDVVRVGAIDNVKRFHK